MSHPHCTSRPTYTRNCSPQALAQERLVACNAAKTLKQIQQPAPADRLQLPNSRRFLYKVVELLFGIEPIWEGAKKQARERIAKRGAAIGVDMPAEVDALRSKSNNWDAELQAVRNESLQYPDYYLNPFHAYDSGNLSWEAAFQVPSAAKLVHAPVMDAQNKALDPDGDAQLRRSYSNKLKQLMGEIGSRPVKTALDVGCATGLSSQELKESFPGAEVMGIDLSPHFLAVGKVMQRDKPEVRPLTRNLSEQELQRSA